MDLFARSWTALQDVVKKLDGAQWVAPSGCRGWLVQDLVCHLVIDAQDVLITLAGTTSADPTRDEIGYWTPGKLPTGTEPDAAFMRRAAAAYESPNWLREHLLDLAVAGGRAAAAADPAARVETMDEVFTVADYLRVYVVEATLHHLDLTAFLPELPGPPAEGLAETRRVLEKHWGAPIPASLDDVAACRVITGRRAPTDEEKAALGDAVSRLPLVLG